MQVAAAEQRFRSSSEQCGQLQRMADERAAQVQAAEVATADSHTKLASATAAAQELQRQLSLAVQQRDNFSSLATDRSGLLCTARCALCHTRSALGHACCALGHTRSALSHACCALGHTLSGLSLALHQADALAEQHYA